MFLKLCLSTALIFALSSAAIAQMTVPEDEVVSKGQLRGGDPAMSAFLAGDYETAEIEFQKNFRIIIRNENLKQLNFEQNRTDQLRATLSDGPPSLSNTGNGGASPVTSARVEAPYLAQFARAEDENELVSGGDKGFQLYMAGMSQLQLKKYDAAKKSFRRAIGFNSRIQDAHFRLGLLELREGNRQGAEEAMEALKKAWKRCRKSCGQQTAIEQNMIDLGVALEKAS